MAFHGKLEDEFMWWQKHRPQTLDDIIIPKKTRQLVRSFIDNGKVPHLLFVSPMAGIGKSTLANIINQEMEADYIELNTSDDNGISTIRDVLKPFATRESLYGDTKIAWLDEFDGTSPQFQKSFRSLMEQYSNNVSFIATANYETQIIPALLDRFTIIDFNFNTLSMRNELLPEMIKRVFKILDAENVEYDKDIVMVYIDDNYPKMRNILKNLQLYAMSNGNIIDKGILKMNVLNEDFFNYILKGQYTKAKEWVLTNDVPIDMTYSELYDKLLPKITDKAKYAPALIKINQYHIWHNQAINGELNFMALLMELCHIMKT